MVMGTSVREMRAMHNRIMNILSVIADGKGEYVTIGSVMRVQEVLFLLCQF